MQGSQQKQPKIKILPAYGVNEMLRMREADIEEVVKTVQRILPQHVDGDVDLTITLLEKNLKLMSDRAPIKETLTHLVRNTMSNCGKFPLTINQVHFGIEPLLNGNESVIGACTFISLGAVGSYISVDEKIKEKILEPFFTTKTEGSGLSLAMAYRIIKHHVGRIKVKGRVGQVKEANIYLPLNRLEIVSMLSIPVG